MGRVFLRSEIDICPIVFSPNAVGLFSFTGLGICPIVIFQKQNQKSEDFKNGKQGQKICSQNQRARSGSKRRSISGLDKTYKSGAKAKTSSMEMSKVKRNGRALCPL